MGISIERICGLAWPSVASDSGCGLRPVGKEENKTTTGRKEFISLVEEDVVGASVGSVWSFLQFALLLATTTKSSRTFHSGDSYAETRAVGTRRPAHRTRSLRLLRCSCRVRRLAAPRVCDDV